MSLLVRSILLLALAGGVAFDVLVPGNATGINAPLLVGAFLGAALVVAGRDGLRRMDPADAWLGPAALVLAGMAAIRADDWLVTADLLLASMLAAGAAACLAGARITRGLVPRVLEVAAGTVAAAGVGALGVLRAPRPVRQDGDGAGRWGRWRGRLSRVAPVGRGLVIALPVLAVFVALFAAADAVFARLTSDVLAWQPDIDLEDLVTRVVVVTVVAWVAAGLLALGAGMLPTFLPTAADEAHRGARPADGSPEPTAPPPAPPAAPAPASGWQASGWQAPEERPAVRLGSTEAATVLVVVDLLFAGFVALQVAYLFGGQDTLATAGLTYAEYARRGFFELVLVAVLAGLLVVTLDLAVAHRSRTQLAAAIVLLGLTAVVLVSALARLRLYQSMYGWTELRFVVLVAIGWLAVALVVAAWLLVTRRTRWTLHALGVMTLVAIAGMNAVGPQAFVTERNLERAIDPSLVPEGGRTGLDTGYLVTLGDEAVIPVVDAWGRLSPADREALAPALDWREEQLRTDPSLQGWPAWNLTRERARAALRAWEAAQGTASR